MQDSKPVPRPDLDTNADLDAWLEQFRVLFYVMKMSHRQIAEIDHGYDPEHPDCWTVFSWEASIRERYPRVEWAGIYRKRPQA